MSQVNKFKQEQNPDYIYFDLQQTNIQNTTEFIQQPLKFVETRDTPIVANSGEYHLSVTRFQLDTYNLPVLVVEPDLTQPDATYNPDQTIYKVAMLPVHCNIKSQISSVTTEVVYENFVTNRQLNYGIYMDFNNGDNGLNVAIAYPQYNGNRGAIIHWKEGNSKDLYTWTGAVNSFIGMFCVSITNNSRWICASISNFPRTFLWDTESNVRTEPAKIITDSYLGPAFISPDTTKIIKMDMDNNTITLRTFDEGSKVVSGNIGTGISSSRFTGEDNVLGENGIGMNFEGTEIVVSNYSNNEGGRGECGAVCFVAINWTTGAGTITPFTGDDSFEYLGWCVCMSADGLVAAASAKGGSQAQSPYIRIYNRVAGTWTQGQKLTGGQVELGDRITLSHDGTFLFVATHSSRNVKRFKRTNGTFAFDKLIATFTAGKVNAACDYNGTKTAVINYDFAGTAPAEEQYIEINAINVGDEFDIPDSIDNVPIIAPVIWKNDYKDAVAPAKAVLDGKNTALYQYYYCNAYENFIARVNTAIRTAYIALIERLYNDWVVITNNASLTNVFVDVIVRQYAPPPFLEWNEAELKAELYATLLFQSQYINVEETINYSSNPDVTWSVVGNNRVGTLGLYTPFTFQLAMNAPLYSLFNTLPASKKVLTAPITLYRENYYIMNFFTTGNDLITPSVPLHTIPSYPFTAAYVVSGNIQYPSQYTANIAHANLLIKQPQELSTIDTWTPASAIVFTTTSLPIVVNQFSASSSIGDKPPSGSTSNEFAFIITDIQSNDQGFRPNVLYTPTAEFRRIDLTGNQPIRNIDISVFWRSTTGALIPMVLASGAQASIKLLFEKKDKTNQKEANASTLATSIRDIV